MKVSELRDKLDIFIDHGHSDDEVVIHCKEVSMGPHAAESLKGVWVGFDWDQGRVLIIGILKKTQYKLLRRILL